MLIFVLITLDILISLILMVGLAFTLLINWLKCRLHPVKRHKVLLFLNHASLIAKGQRGFEHLLQFHNPYLKKCLFVIVMAEETQAMEITDKLVVITIAEPKLAKALRLVRLTRSGIILSLTLCIPALVGLARGEHVGIVRSINPNIIGFLSVMLKTILDVKLILDVRANFDLLYKQVPALFFWGMQIPHFLQRLSYFFERQLRRFVYSHADLIFGGNENNLKSALENGANPRKARLVRINIAPNFFDLSNLKDLKDELGLNDFKLLVFVGRFEPEKYPEDVIIAFSGVAKLRKDTKLIMVGDGSLRGELEALVEKHRLNGDVIFLGYPPHVYVRNILYSADVVLVPLGGEIGRAHV